MLLQLIMGCHGQSLSLAGMGHHHLLSTETSEPCQRVSKQSCPNSALPQEFWQTRQLALLRRAGMKLCRNPLGGLPALRSHLQSRGGQQRSQVEEEPPARDTVGQLGLRAGHKQMQVHSYPREQRVASGPTTDTHSYIWNIQTTSRPSAPKAGRLPESWSPRTGVTMIPDSI